MGVILYAKCRVLGLYCSSDRTLHVNKLVTSSASSVFLCQRDCVLCVFCSCHHQMPSFEDKINTVIIRRRVNPRVHQLLLLLLLLITTKRSSSILSTETKTARSCRRGTGFTIRLNWFISQWALHWKSSCQKTFIFVCLCYSWVISNTFLGTLASFSYKGL